MPNYEPTEPAAKQCKIFKIFIQMHVDTKELIDKSINKFTATEQFKGLWNEILQESIDEANQKSK